MASKINNFTAIDSVYGTFVVNRHCSFQAEALIKTGKPHINDEIEKILGIIATFPDRAIAVDAGANIGLIASPMAQALKPHRGVVLAFEIQRMMYYALCGSAALNDLENLFVYNMGLGAEMGEAMIGMPDYGSPQDFGMFSLLNQQGPRSESVRIVTVDSLDLPRLDLLKIDVEGVEIEVLKGAAKSIEAFRPWCWVECWQVGAEAIKARFEGLDYECFRIDDLNLLCAPAEKLTASNITIEAPPV